MAAILRPNIVASGQSSRVLQTTYDGVMCTAGFPLSGSSVVYRLTGASAISTISLAFYVPDSAGVFNLFASSSFTMLVTGAQNVTAPITTDFANVMGYRSREVCVLYGRSSLTGSASIRTYGTLAYDLLNQNVPVGSIPLGFTTTLLCSLGPPATISPALWPASSLDLAPVMRLV